MSQSLGHHIANDSIRDWVFDKIAPDAAPKFEQTPYDVAIIGDYNIGGDAWSSRILLEEMGLRVIAQWSGDGSLAELEATPKAKLNVLHCYRSMNYISRHMEEKYGIPWCEYNFFGPSKIAESLRKIAGYFDDKIKEGAERVIAKYQPLMDAVIAKYRPRLEGKTVMLFVGGLRPRHVIGAYEDLGMEVVGTGYEFGHNDDYQRTAQHYVKDGTLIYDDVTGYEFEKFVEKIQPDLVGSGIKEKYVFQKMGVPFRQMHSWDYSGPYHGYDGFAIFARDMDMAINCADLEDGQGPVEIRSPADPDGRGITARCLGSLRWERAGPRSTIRIRRGLHHDPECRTRARSLRAVPRSGIPGDAGEQEEDVREPARSRRSRAGPRMDQDAGISREELRARSADGQSGQSLPAAWARCSRPSASRARCPSCTARRAASPIIAATSRGTSRSRAPASPPR